MDVVIRASVGVLGGDDKGVDAVKRCLWRSTSLCKRRRWLLIDLRLEIGDMEAVNESTSALSYEL